MLLIAHVHTNTRIEELEVSIDNRYLKTIVNEYNPDVIIAQSRIENEEVIKECLRKNIPCALYYPNELLLTDYELSNNNIILTDNNAFSKIGLCVKTEKELRIACNRIVIKKHIKEA